MNGKQLKNSILQWAIQGKLVPQDPNDEPASVLLEKIRQEKERLIKEKKIKRDKNASIIYRGEDNSYYEKMLATGEVKCIDEEIPFEIPQGWEWCRVSSLFQINPKVVAEDNTSAAFIPMEAISAGYGSEFRYYEKEWGEIKSGYTAFADNDIAFAKITPCFQNRKSAIFEGLPNGIGAGTTELKILRTYGETINRWFVLYFLESPYFIDEATFKGTANQQRIIVGYLENKLFPLPPLAEQERIVDKIGLVMPIIDKYSKSQELLDKMNVELNEYLKKSVLQEAIQGKLVPQIAEEGTAHELLEQIKAKKLKLVKEGKLKKSALNDSVIFRGDDNKYYTINKKERISVDDEIPFDIPNTWEWCRLGTLFSHSTGKALNASNLKGQLMTYITTSNLYWDRFELDNLKQMRFTDEEIEKCTATFGDLLVCEGGDIGRAAIWNYQYDIRIQNHIHKLRAYKQLCTKFFFWLFYFYKATGRIGGKGIGIQGLSSKALDNILIPLPPLKEQQRIVAQIEKLFKQFG
ncbi:restriction endonuclease subunit S [Segatella copri]|uniref:Restriction endonuclease subunit S n=1 Tax=Segatella copri TaxID=165179 RepID=A0AA92T7A5_9BACT|nr:restriction endonuclease subunit S [Segatella copri]RGN13257.1 restriction endonuclease subunit S [Segatella copri]